MQRIPNYKHFKHQIVDNLIYCTPKQALYMEKYLVEQKNTREIAEECGKEKSTVSRTLQRAWSKLRLVIVDDKQVEAIFTFNAAGDIIGMKATRTAVRGKRGRIRP